MTRPKTSPRTLKRCINVVVGLCLLDKRDPVVFISQAVRECLKSRRREVWPLEEQR